MKLSVVTTITNPEQNEYAWKEAIQNYCEFADEVVVVDGFSVDGSLEKLEAMAKDNSKIKVVKLYWPQDEWKWEELPKHINYGFEYVTGDIGMKMDIDYFLHEKSYTEIRKRLQDMLDKDQYVSEFLKFTILNKRIGYYKSPLLLAVNMKYYPDIIGFGKAIDRENDWCIPVEIDELREDKFDWDKFYVGLSIQKEKINRTGIFIYNYDYFFRTKKKAKDIFWKFAQAHNKDFENSWGNTKEEAWKVFIQQEKSRIQQQILQNVEHPSVLRKKMNKMTVKEFGFNNWNNFQDL